MEENFDELHLPDELNKTLADTLSVIAQFIHKEKKSSHVFIKVEHVSDALMGQGNTSIQIGGMNVDTGRVREVANNLLAAADAMEGKTAMSDEEKKTHVEDLVKQMMDKAKQKGEGK